MIESVRTKNHTEPSKVHYDDQKARKRMITLTPYQPQYRQITLKRIEAFWGFHRDLVQKTQEQPPEEPDCLVIQDLESWTSNDHWLFVILKVARLNATHTLIRGIGEGVLSQRISYENIGQLRKFLLERSLFDNKRFGNKLFQSDTILTFTGI